MNKILFYLSARMFGEAVLELYIYRIAPNGHEQVFLLPRPENDPFYSAQYHIPGVRKIPCETDKDHLQRLLRELPFVINENNIEYVLSTTLKTKRGTDFSDIRRVEVSYNAKHINFYDVDNLPKNITEHHKIIIRKVLECTDQ